MLDDIQVSIATLEQSVSGFIGRLRTELSNFFAQDIEKQADGSFKIFASKFRQIEAAFRSVQDVAEQTYAVLVRPAEEFNRQLLTSAGNITAVTEAYDIFGNKLTNIGERVTSEGAKLKDVFLQLQRDTADLPNVTNETVNGIFAAVTQNYAQFLEQSKGYENGAAESARKFAVNVTAAVSALGLGPGQANVQIRELVRGNINSGTILSDAIKSSGKLNNEILAKATSQGERIKVINDALASLYGDSAKVLADKSISSNLQNTVDLFNQLLLKAGLLNIDKFETQAKNLFAATKANEAAFSEFLTPLVTSGAEGAESLLNIAGALVTLSNDLGITKVLAKGTTEVVQAFTAALQLLAFSAEGLALIPKAFNAILDSVPGGDFLKDAASAVVAFADKVSSAGTEMRKLALLGDEDFKNYTKGATNTAAEFAKLAEAANSRLNKTQIASPSEALEIENLRTKIASLNEEYKSVEKTSAKERDIRLQIVGAQQKLYDLTKDLAPLSGADSLAAQEKAVQQLKIQAETLSALGQGESKEAAAINNELEKRLAIISSLSEAKAEQQQIDGAIASARAAVAKAQGTESEASAKKELEILEAAADAKNKQLQDDKALFAELKKFREQAIKASTLGSGDQKAKGLADLKATEKAYADLENRIQGTARSAQIQPKGTIAEQLKLEFQGAADQLKNITIAGQDQLPKFIKQLTSLAESLSDIGQLDFKKAFAEIGPLLQNQKLDAEQRLSLAKALQKVNDKQIERLQLRNDIDKRSIQAEISRGKISEEYANVLNNVVGINEKQLQQAKIENELRLAIASGNFLAIKQGKEKLAIAKEEVKAQRDIVKSAELKGSLAKLQFDTDRAKARLDSAQESRIRNTESALKEEAKLKVDAEQGKLDAESKANQDRLALQELYIAESDALAKKAITIAEKRDAIARGEQAKAERDSLLARRQALKEQSDALQVSAIAEQKAIAAQARELNSIQKQQAQLSNVGNGAGFTGLAKAAEAASARKTFAIEEQNLAKLKALTATTTKGKLELEAQVRDSVIATAKAGLDAVSAEKAALQELQELRLKSLDVSANAFTSTLQAQNQLYKTQLSLVQSLQSVQSSKLAAERAGLDSAAKALSVLKDEKATTLEIRVAKEILQESGITGANTEKALAAAKFELQVKQNNEQKQSQNIAQQAARQQLEIELQTEAIQLRVSKSKADTALLEARQKQIDLALQQRQAIKEGDTESANLLAGLILAQKDIVASQEQNVALASTALQEAPLQAEQRRNTLQNTQKAERITLNSQLRSSFNDARLAAAKEGIITQSAPEYGDIKQGTRGLRESINIAPQFQAFSKIIETTGNATNKLLADISAKLDRQTPQQKAEKTGIAELEAFAKASKPNIVVNPPKQADPRGLLSILGR